MRVCFELVVFLLQEELLVLAAAQRIWRTYGVVLEKIIRLWNITARMATFRTHLLVII